MNSIRIQWLAVSVADIVVLPAYHVGYYFEIYRIFLECMDYAWTHIVKCTGDEEHGNFDILG